MLAKWTLGNFKSVADETTLELKPVTILAGANSSGKSTVLQSILAIAQTLKATPGPSPLVFNGEYTRLGYLSDILHNQNMRDPLIFGFELTSNNQLKKKYKEKSDIFLSSLKMKICADDDPLYEDTPQYGELKKVTITWGRTNELQIEAMGREYNKIQQNYERMVISQDLQSDLNEGKYKFTIQKSTLLHRHIPPHKPLVAMDYFLPKSILETFDNVNYSAQRNLVKISELLKEPSIDSYPLSADNILLNELNLDKPENRLLKTFIREVLKDALRKRGTTRAQQQNIQRVISRLASEPGLGDGIRRVMRDESISTRRFVATHLKQSSDQIKLRGQKVPVVEIGVRSDVLPPEVQSVTNEITRFFTQNIYYLGPLRVEPQFVYSLPPYPELTHVGLKGEFTAPVLEHFRGKHIEFPLPPDHKMVKKGNLTDNAPLFYALQLWLEYMGLVENITTTDKGKMGTELTVRSEGVNRELDLTSIGVGVSQVLPTLVMGLIAPSGTTLLLEQPELHLHPRIQSRLADFLLGVTRVGKQCIVETHSEYLINRLRRRVAEDETDSLSKDIQIYFVEREAGKTQFRNVNMNDYGAILKWPKGFFDEGPREADLIMEAAMKKKRKSILKTSKITGGRQ